ncbi:MAG: transcriptional regulator [Bacillota bacterium]
MKGYPELALKIIFDFNDALDVFKNKATAYGNLSRLEKQGLIKKVRNNLYASINPVTQTAFASKYQIGSSINDNAYVSHISALEYYGYQNQVSHICYVSSSNRFNTFEFEGITYIRVAIKTKKGVVSPPYTQMLKITGIEKTVIDSIQTIGSIINLEELIYSLELIPMLDEKKLIEYLEAYNIQALYQKSGYILSLFNGMLKLSESFFVTIQNKMSKGVTYLSEDAKQDGVFISKYQVVVPKWLTERGQSHEI